MSHPRATFHQFDSVEAARTYRHEHGIGGWIFADDVTAFAVLFPPDMTPVNIFNHPLTKSRSGKLIGHG